MSFSLRQRIHGWFQLGRFLKVFGALPSWLSKACTTPLRMIRLLPHILRSCCL